MNTENGMSAAPVECLVRRLCALSQQAIHEHRQLRKDIMRSRGGYQSQAMVPDPEWCFELQDAIDDVARNAQLLAAVPDLLAALNQTLTWIEADEATHGRAFGTGNVARAAIAKATDL